MAISRHAVSRAGKRKAARAINDSCGAMHYRNDFGLANTAGQKRGHFVWRHTDLVLAYSITCRLIWRIMVVAGHISRADHNLEPARHHPLGVKMGDRGYNFGDCG